MEKLSNMSWWVRGMISIDLYSPGLRIWVGFTRIRTRPLDPTLFLLNKIHLLLFSFAIKVDIIDIVILYYP